MNTIKKQWDNHQGILPELSVLVAAIVTGIIFTIIALGGPHEVAVKVMEMRRTALGDTATEDVSPRIQQVAPSTTD